MHAVTQRNKLILMIQVLGIRYLSERERGKRERARELVRERERERERERASERARERKSHLHHHTLRHAKFSLFAGEHWNYGCSRSHG
jgi:hypothetical protein